MPAGRRPNRTRRGIAEVVAEILLVALTVTLVSVLIMFYAPLIPSSLPRPLGSAIELGPAVKAEGQYSIPVIYTSGPPVVGAVLPFVEGASGLAIPGVTWTAILVGFNDENHGTFHPGAGWSTDTPTTHFLSAGDRFVVEVSMGMNMVSGSSFGLAGTNGWSGEVSVLLP